MLSGVEDIELLPYIGKMDISDRISQLFSMASSIRASIAFWAISPEALNDVTNGQAYRILSSENSFLCVDIQRPTNIDYLADLARNGVKVYLNIRKLPKSLSHMSTSLGLLHTKILLADKPNSMSEFWIGSHNWTCFAIMGPNTEASLIIHMDKGAHLYSISQMFLEYICHRYCRPFEINKIDYYKTIQQALDKAPQTYNVVELEGNDVNELNGSVICVFGTEKEDLNSQIRAGNSVYVSIHDSKTENKYLYKAEILHAGVLSASNPAAGGISLTKRRYAYTEGRRFPVLETAAEPSQTVFDKSYYFMNMQIHRRIDRAYSIYDKPSRFNRKLWSKAFKDPADQLIDRQRLMRYVGVKKILQSLIEVPIDDENAQDRQSDLSFLNYVEKPLIEKRAARDYRLISKKVIDFK
jgi:hypothetical protein